MKRFQWQVAAGIILILLSCVIYMVHYVLFRDLHHILIYLIGDIAFLPVEVLVVTMIVDQVLKAREKKAVLVKLNMVIGIFFSKMGMDLLKDLSKFDSRTAMNRALLIFGSDWNMRSFARAAEIARSVPCDIDSRSGDLEELKHSLGAEKDFLLMLLGNPNLLEHETFTDLLWALTHLAEELALRGDLANLADADYSHLSVDIKRAYELLRVEWLMHVGHLKNNYPHLFSLAVRTNPYDPMASVAFR